VTVGSPTSDVEDRGSGASHRELMALDALVKSSAESVDLDEVLCLALDRIREITGLETAYVSLYDEESRELKVVAYTAREEDSSGKDSRTMLPQDLVGQVARTAEAVLVDDTWVDPRFSDGTAAQPQARSIASLPLQSRGTVLGVLSVASAQPFRFTPLHQTFLSILAGQLSWAIESAVLRQRLDSSRLHLRERVKELSILYDVSREALVAGNVGSFLSFVARRLPASMQYQRAKAVVFCQAGASDYSKWSDSVDEAIAERLAVVPGEGTLGRLLVERGVLLEYEVSGLEPFLGECDVRSVLAVPVFVDGGTVGSIAVYYHNDKWRFLEEEIDLLRGISEQVAQYVARDAVERENQRHVQEVSTLFEVSKTLASVVDIEGLLPAMQHTLIEALAPAEAGVLFLFDEVTGMLRVASSFGYHVESLHRITLRVGESMSGKVFESGRPEVWSTPDESESAMATMTVHNREFFRQASRGLDFPRSAVGVPLIYRDQKIGVLTLETFASAERFSASHVPFLQALAELLVINLTQIRLLQETEEARAMQEADRLRSELIAALAHDMRTPLTSIQGYASALLLDDVEWDETARARQLQIIEAEARDLQAMIQDLLESSIVDAGLMTLAKEPTLVPRLVESLVREMTRRTARHRFVISFPADFPILDADPRRLEQVIRNLLDNAVKYSPDGGLVVLRGQVAGDEVIISVADNGVGIAPEHLNRLFEKFFRVKSPIGEKVRGTGLGLPVSRTIVESHGGRIWAESEVGKGTTMYFSLPIQRGAETYDND
jgi:K+-sensing histidine kinase KdpD